MMTTENCIKPGDKISAMGFTITVGSILFQDYHGNKEQAGGGDCWGYDVEFLDVDGCYHHWKQNQDFGEVIRADKDGKEARHV